MAVKATWLFNGSASGKVWGFSESWYTNLSGDILLAAMDLVSAKRRLILSGDSAIVGYRIGQPTGRAFVIRRSFLAPSRNGGSNLPVDCALCSVAVQGSPTIKKFFLHDLPDGFVENAAISNDADIRLPIQQAVDAYVQGGFQVRYQDPAAIKANVLSIDATGKVDTVQNFVVLPNQVVSFLNARDVNNRTVRGQFVIKAVTSPTEFTLANWTGQVVGRRGSVRLVSYLFGLSASRGELGVMAAASRKVGRPFFQLRGRVPIKR